MLKLVMDSLEIEVEEGATILDAAAKAGIEIPTLCFLKGHPPCASCMVCVVKLKGVDRYVPSCATKVEDGMVVESGTDEVFNARRSALSLLLGDHLGDCVAPCAAACPAHMDIPSMNSLIAAGKFFDAAAVARRSIPLAASLGRVCPAPCERACRRSVKDKAVAVCLLKRFAGDAGSEAELPFAADAASHSTSRKVAIIGAGPAGLGAACRLRRDGHACVIFDDHSEPGGMLRYGVGEDRLPRSVLDAEIRQIARIGVEFRMGSRIGKDISLADLRSGFDVVLVAMGRIDEAQAAAFDLEFRGRGLRIERNNFETTGYAVFAAGSAVAPSQVAVRAMAEGAAAASAISKFMAGMPPAVDEPPFSVHFGKMTEVEMERFAEGASGEPRVESGGGADGGLTKDEARREASRCLHCECRKADACLLRKHAHSHYARPAHHKARRTFEHDVSHPLLVYEPGKCVACGICQSITERARERYGLAFVGRGFGVRIAVPLGGKLSEGLCHTARECAAACPTGALSLKNPQSE